MFVRVFPAAFRSVTPDFCENDLLSFFPSSSFPDNTQRVSNWIR
jgi:hypothetical protein